jgi:zinc transport system substrate-binding protein
MKKVLFIISLVFMLLLLWNCNGKVNETKDTVADENIKEEKPVVTVSILPQRYFVERIVGDKYKINVMIPPGHSPHTYEPTPREMKTVSDSVIYFRIGHIAFENAWMDKIASLNKKMKIVDTSEGVSLITGEEEHENEHEGEEGHHHHGGIDPHTWLSLPAVKIQLKHILDAINEYEIKNGKSNNTAIFEINYNNFIRDIDELQAENERILAPLKGKKFMVYHPSWSYFARDYGLIQFPIEIEGKTPGPADLKQIIDTAKDENIRIIIVQKQFDSHNARTVADEINGKVIMLDPLAPNWLENMKEITLTFKEALQLNEGVTE